MRNLQEPLIWAVVSCAVPSEMTRQMRAEIIWITTVKKLINQSGCFENTPKFNCILHVPIHKETQYLLRFYVDGQIYQFKALPFRLATAPLEFTKDPRLSNTVINFLSYHFDLVQGKIFQWVSYIYVPVSGI